jgi:hypothetical protein
MQYQRGFGMSDMPVFVGMPYQRGSGFGSFFSSLFRHIMPVLGTAARTFITSAAEDLGAGGTLRSAARHALMPTVMDGVSSAVQEIRKARNRNGGSGDQMDSTTRGQQAGSGHRRRKGARHRRKRRAKHGHGGRVHKAIGQRGKRHAMVKGQYGGKRHAAAKGQHGGKAKSAAYYKMLKKKYGRKIVRSGRHTQYKHKQPYRHRPTQQYRHLYKAHKGQLRKANDFTNF